MSPHIRFQPIKHGFYRIYFRNAYIGECFKDMPEMGYEIFERSFQFDDYSHYQEFHDNVDTTLRVKNFVEGYWETKKRLRMKLYNIHMDKEFYATALKGYSQARIK
jgi:hypothetical protein